jgi:hypothetical protein
VNVECKDTQTSVWQCNVTTRIEQVQDKKITLTGQRRNTMFQSCDYPHFICISFRQFDCFL